ncbi:MAG TPA: HAD hydrolase family protein [Jiangellaceae bacterium]|nr:HAD hydrolase family protein [Jiangellaceae bacterium]
MIPPGWKPQLVALDVDGTILTYEDFFDPPRQRVIQAVRRTVDAGVHVVLATGRSLHSTLPVLDQLGLTDGYVVCSNGAVVADVATRAPLHVVTFDASDPVQYFAEHIPDAVLAIEELGVGFRVTGDFPVGELDGRVTVVSHDELLDEPVTRLVVRWPQGDRERLRRVAAASGLPSVDYAIGYTAWLDIMPEGVSKASGLSTVCENLGLGRADVMAVGDGHNDMEMLAWAGVGVAMGQAPWDVQNVADAVCEGVDEDGVAVLLNDLFA